MAPHSHKPPSLMSNAATVVDALGKLNREAVVVHSDVVARALSLVSPCHSLTVPTKSAQAILAALEGVAALLEQHIAASATNDKRASYVYTPTEIPLMEAGLTLLWAHVTTYELYVAVSDLLHAIAFMPRALHFWKKRAKKQLRGLQHDLLLWATPQASRIAVTERIRCLSETLDAHLKKIGRIKEMTTRLMSTSTDLEELEHQVKLGVVLLAEAYSSYGLVAPRRGKGAFQTMTPLLFTALHFDERGSFGGRAGITCGADVLESLQRLRANLNVARDAQQQFKVGFAAAMVPCRPPSRLQQRWLQLTVAALCVTSGGIWVIQNQDEFKAAITTLGSAMRDFLSEHMIAPLQVIIGEILLDKKLEIQDAAALEDTKDSLRRMLAQFVQDTNPTLPEADLQRVMKDMDMSVVSLQYEKQLASAVRNLMSGDIVRMLLIQVQFIKKELMVAMGAIDELMHANQLNLQMLATIPTFIVFGGLYSLTKQLFFSLYRRTSERLYNDPGDIAALLRHNLRDVERLLNKQNCNHRGNGSKNNTSHEEISLGVRDLGHLILLLHQLRESFEAHRDLFQEDSQQDMEEDLNDLIEEGLQVSQQLAVIQRMYHTHPFLLQIKKSAQWLLM